jgi:hypothetical protein
MREDKAMKMSRVLRQEIRKINPMITPFETLEGVKTIVFSYSLLVLATAVCDQLEKVGLLSDYASSKAVLSF